MEEYARRKPGVYFRLERDLYSRVDQMGVEMRERAKWDIRESMVGTETFEPKHIIIATWKNVSFAGGITSANRIVIIFEIIILFYIFFKKTFVYYYYPTIDQYFPIHYRNRRSPYICHFHL